ncbi:MAG TPA: glycosyltransferase [Pirellulales bacterium]|nr:glycosyltransferase [Pirellulales bacterium]
MPLVGITAPAVSDKVTSRPATTVSAPPRRVLHIVNGEHYAGAERVQDLLATRLPELGFEVTFACVKPDRFPALRQARQCPLYDTAMRHRFDLWPARELARLVRKEKYSLIHTHTPRTLLVGCVAAALARVSLVHHLHSPALADTTDRWRNRINSAAERFTVRRATAVIAVSESLADYAQRAGLARRRPHVIPNGVPVVDAPAARETPRERWTIGVVALFRPRKGLEVMLDALARLVQSGHDVQLRVIGNFETPAYERAIHKRAEQLGLYARIEWRGFQRNVAAELAALDLFVLPSLFGEGMPMVVLEAMAAGVPVVASNVAGASEVVRHGQDGLLVEPADVDGLAGAIGRFVSGQIDWQALRTSAYRRQIAQFSDQSMAHSVAEVYRTVLGD